MLHQGKNERIDLTSKRVPIDPTPIPKTYNQAFDFRSPITSNSPPQPPSIFQTATAIPI